MEKIEHDFDRDDSLEIDDVLDRSFFTDDDDLSDLDDDETFTENKSLNFRSISEL